MAQFEAFVEWLRTFDEAQDGGGDAAAGAAALWDGAALSRALALLAPRHYDAETFDAAGENWMRRLASFRGIVRGVEAALREAGDPVPSFNVTALCRTQDEAELAKLVEALLWLAVTGDDKSRWIAHMQSLSRDTLSVLAPILGRIQQEHAAAHEQQHPAGAAAAGAGAGGSSSGVGGGSAAAAGAGPDDVGAALPTSALQRQLTEARERVSELQEEAAEQRRKFAELLGEHSALEQESAALRDQVAAAAQFETHAKARLEDFEIVSTHLAEREKEVASLKDQLTFMHDKTQLIARMEEDLEVARQRSHVADRLEVQVENYRRKLEESAEMASEHSRLRIEHQKLLDRMGNAEVAVAQVKTQEEKIRELKANVSALEYKQRSLLADLAAKSKESERLRKELSAAQDKSAALRSENARLLEQQQGGGAPSIGAQLESSSMRDISDENQRLRNELEALREATQSGEHGAMLVDLQEQLQAVREERDTLQNLLIEEQGKSRDMESELTELRDKAARLEAKSMNSGVAQDKAIGKLAAAEKELRAMKTELDALRKERAALESELQVAKLAHEEQSERVSVLEVKLSSQGGDTMEAMRKLDDIVESKTAELKQKVHELTSALNKREEELRLAVDEARTVTAELKATKEEKDRFSSKLLQLVDDLEGARKEVNTLKEQLHAVRSAAPPPPRTPATPDSSRDIRSDAVRRLEAERRELAAIIAELAHDIVEMRAKGSASESRSSNIMSTQRSRVPDLAASRR